MTGRPLAAFIAHTGIIEALAFSADGKTLVSGSRDQRIRIWDVPSAGAKSTRDKER